MVEITKNLFIGDDNDFKSVDKSWCVIHACKEPYHRALLGYRTPGCPKCDEYYFAERGNILYLNLVDANDVRYIPKIVIDKALSFIEEHIEDNKILVHCNLGQSRSASIGLLYLRRIGYYDELNAIQGMSEYKNLYEKFNPNPGMTQYVIQNW